jgi:hypothetical protein
VIPRARPPSLALALALAGTVAAAPTVAHACTCARAEKPDVKTSLAGAALVAEARVDAHDFVVDVGWQTRVTLLRSYKGGDAEHVEITAAKTCAVAFEVGARYLVYATADGDAGYTTTYCSRTAKFADAAADLEVLRRLVKDPIAQAEVAPLLTLALGGWSSDPVVHGLRLLALLLHAGR